jgi:acetylornithine/N-succinyldiaminopimelate aminotransferase
LSPIHLSALWRISAPQGVDGVTQSHLLPTYARIDLAFERGEGAWLITTEGERYLDFGAGIAVASLGYNHPHLVKALHHQADLLWHTSNLFRIPQGERLAQRLCAATFADVVFFTNSGAEALECAIKMARKFHSANGQPERYRIITFEGAFHGRTLATVAATGNPKYLDGFGPKVDGFDQVPFGDHDALKAAIGPNTGAILIEPIQGEGGIRPIPPHCLKALRALCDEHGLLLIFDEVQTGVARTGALYAYQNMDVAPDIMTSAKGLGGGFPIGACLATQNAAKGMTAGTHGTTYGGNPLAMACANAVLDVVSEPSFMAHVSEMGLKLRQQLSALQDHYPRVIEEVRGQGLIMGLKLRVPNAEFAAAARAHHLLIIPAGDNVVRLLPPLIISPAEIDLALERLEQACAAMDLQHTPAASSGAQKV